MNAFLTEKEASGQWCPLVGVIAETRMMRPMTTREEVLGEHKQGEPTSCIGSRCMAWRWKLLDRGAPMVEAGYGGDKEPVGYCGQFGHPHQRFNVVS